MATLTLNPAAKKLEKFSTAAKIRAKMVDGTMFIRPTHRKAPVNLPKNEKLVDLAGGKVSIEGMDAAAGTYNLRADKYGWFALIPGEASRGSAAVKVA